MDRILTRSTIEVGDSVPPLTLSAHDGSEVSLSDYLGKQSVVLFYYPRAHTGGCTMESAAFGERYREFAEAGAEVFGASGDTPGTNARFAEKLNLPFKLLSDKDLKVWRRLGVREVKGQEIKRITFVIDKAGTLRLAYFYGGRGDVTSHVDEALACVRQLAREQPRVC